MKKIKKAAAFLLALSFILPSALFVACRDGQPSVSDSVSSGSTQSTPIENPSQSSSNAAIEDSSSEDSSSQEESSSSESSFSQEDSSSSESNSAPNSPSSPSTSSSTSKEESSETEPIAQLAQYIKCTGDNVNIRSGAGTNYAVLGSAEKNTRYAVLGKTGNWYKTYYKGKTAYVNASYVAVFSIEKSENAKVEKVLDEGYKLIGVPYVYGAVRLHDGNGNMLKGFTAQKFDCSSLVQYVFYKGANKVLQVHTRSQVLQGKKVKSGDLKRGDCMFFTNESRKHLTGIERIGHVAIYLGNNYILHTASDYARIEKISDGRWNNFIEARRFL